MNKPIIILLLILTIVSCEKKTESKIDKIEFQNKTFNLISESEPDTLFIEFQDSTHQIFGNLWQEKIPWRISNYNSSNFLVLDNRVIGIKKLSEGRFDCTYIGLRDNSFELGERKPKWNKELLNGTWVEKELFEYHSNDSIPKPPHIPAPPGFSESDLQYPPLYKINGDSIHLAYAYHKSKSLLEINNTGEFVKMHLENFDLGLGVKESLWRIKFLSDSLMIIDKTGENTLEFGKEKKLNNIKLIKKR